MPGRGRRGAGFLDHQMVVEEVDLTSLHQLPRHPGRRRVERIGAEIRIMGPHELVAQKVAGPVGRIAFAEAAGILLDAINGRAHALDPCRIQKVAHAHDTVARIGGYDVRRQPRRVVRPGNRVIHGYSPHIWEATIPPLRIFVKRRLLNECQQPAWIADQDGVALLFSESFARISGTTLRNMCP